MTVNEFCQKASLTVLALPNPDSVIDGAYSGDLLSWVMGNSSEGNLWVTIMTNSNIVAVASLVGISAIILAEGVKPDENTIALASEKGVNILSSDKSVYELCVLAGALL